MNIEDIRQIASIINEYGLESVEISSGGDLIRVKKPRAGGERQPPRQKQEAEVSGCRNDSKETDDTDLVLSPIVGVFYSAPSPGSQPFVRVGTRVRRGETLCILEAMKMMNEITAEYDGEITEVLAFEGQIIEYGQPLMRISRKYQAEAR